MDTTRILLVEDHPMYRAGLRETLEQHEDLTVVGEAGSVADALRVAADTQPDIVLMDVSLPDGTGVQATKLLKERYPGVAVLALTAYDEDEYVFTILQSGASGYLLKTANATELISAVRAVSTGESVLSPSIARKVVSRAARQPDPEDLVEPLSTRELEVLRLAAEGLTNRQIGARLAMSPRTAQTHLSNVYSKMGVQSRTEAVTRAIERGWLAARGRPRRLE